MLKSVDEADIKKSIRENYSALNTISMFMGMPYTAAYISYKITVNKVLKEN